MKIQYLNTELLEAKKQKLTDHKNNINNYLSEIKELYLLLERQELWTGKKSEEFFNTIKEFWLGLGEYGPVLGPVENVVIDLDNSINFIDKAIIKSKEKDESASKEIENVN